MLRVRIAATSQFQAGRPRTTRELVAESAQKKTADELELLTGIQSRHFFGPDDTCASQGATAVQMALDLAGVQASQVKRLILTNSTGFDMACPATANVISDTLGMDGTCGSLDLNNACMGYLNAIDFGARLVHTGVSPVAVVASEGGSRHISPADPRPYLIFGCAAGACVLTAPEPTADCGILASHFGNIGKYRDSVVMYNGSLTGQRECLQFLTTNKEITKLAMLGLRSGIEAVFAEAGIGWAQVDWVVAHQPNGAMLTDIVAEFGIDPRKLVRVVHYIGNCGSASTAVGLAELYRTQPVTAGQTILLCGVGAGLSYGALLYRVG